MNNKEMAKYVMEQLAPLDGEVRCIQMMGGYIFYYRERIFGGLYGSGELLVKVTNASKRYLTDSVPDPPYEGAKPMLAAPIVEDSEKLCAMVKEMYDELPARKQKK